MANVSLSTDELKKAFLFVAASTLVIGGIVGLVRHFGFDAEPTAALVLGLISGVSWAVVF